MKHAEFRLAALAAVLALAAAGAPARAGIIASDNFPVPPYVLGPLNGQAASGFGFTGTWAQFLGQDLSVVSNGNIGRPTVTAGNAGDFASFAAGGFTVSSGQLFIGITIANQRNAGLFSTRLDTSTFSPEAGGFRTTLGNINFGGPNGSDFNLVMEGGLGTVAVAQTNINSTGTHKLVGVLDFTNMQVAIFVDPTLASFYHSDGTNNANAVAAWTPAGPLTFRSANLVENLDDQVNFSRLVYSTDFASAAGIPEPASLTLLGIGLTSLLGYGWRKRGRS
jgi:hypothetical protein